MAANEMPTEDVWGTAFGREVTGSTLIALGLIVSVFFLIWLVRRNA